jgi:Ca-activated chloride channel family protein
MNMRFAEPQWLLVGFVAVTLLGAVMARGEILTSRALALLEGARLRARSASPSRARRWLRVIVVTSAIAMGFVALARPQKGMHWETMERTGTDLLLVVDTSRSMDSDDVKPSRLERAKLAIHDLVDRFPGDRVGLVAFAGDAFLQSPMTLDHAALLESVDALDTATIARGGTNVGRGIDVAADALATEPGRQKVMVLLTDGEDLEGQGLAEAKRAASAGITIDTVGVGTLAGELVPARDARGAAIGVLRDEDGKPVRSHLDETSLQAIAAAAHGSYQPLGVDGRGLDRLYDQSLAGLTHAETSSRTRRVYSELFELPLGLSLLGLVVHGLLGRRWRGGAVKRGRSPAAASAMAAAAAGLLLFAAAGTAHASVEGAAQAYAAGKFEDAAKEFEEESARHPKDVRLAFNAGDAAYRAGHFEAAEAAFKRALSGADPRLQEQVLYNEGDVLYRAGDPLKPEAREQTIASWKAAIAAYEGAMALDPKDADARFNRDFVKRKLDALEQQPKPEPKKDDPKDSKQDGDGSKDKPKDSKAGGTGKDGSPGSSGDKEPKSGPGGSKPKPGGAGAGSQARPGDSGKDDTAQPGHLSVRDARGLLDALRGEERMGVSHGTDAGQPPPDDSPRKDW